MKLPTIYDTESDDSFKFITNYDEWFHTMGFMKKHGVEFVTYIGEKF